MSIFCSCFRLGANNNTRETFTKESAKSLIRNKQKETTVTVNEASFKFLNGSDKNGFSKPSPSQVALLQNCRNNLVGTGASFDDPAPLILLNFGLRGRIYGSSMPRSMDAIQKLKENEGITHIVSLLPNDDDPEYRIFDKKIGKKIPLERAYKKYSFFITQFPIENGKVPNNEALGNLIAKIQGIVSSSKNAVMIHCFSGRGRTGFVIACLAKEVFGFSGPKAIQWTRLI